MNPHPAAFSKSVRVALAAAQPELEIARDLFQEYAAELGFALCFQDFDGELARWPDRYARPRGALWIGWAGDEPAGCIGLRPLEDDACEMKRLYVRAAQRGTGLGRMLAEASIAEARTIGYGRMRLDTLPSMEAAQALYERLGFRPIPPYTPNPIPGARYLELALGGDGRP